MVTEIPDSVPPVLASGAISLSYGHLTIVASETLELSPFSVDKFDISRFHLSDAIGLQNASLNGSRVLYTNQDSTQVIVELTEAQRVAAIQLSATSGGDGTPLILEAKDHSFTDIGQLKNQFSTHTVLSESADTIVPRITNATLSYGLGTLVLIASETILLTSQSKVNFTAIVIRNDTSDPGIRLTGADVVEVNDVFVTINLLETQRIPLLYLSGTPGGEGSPVVIDFEHGAFQDIALNPSSAVANVVAVEFPDNIPPNVLSASINYTDGTLTLEADEYIDSTPTDLVNLSLMQISDVAEDRSVPLDGAEVVSYDGEILTLFLTESQRALALAISGVPGGNSNAAFLDVRPGSLTDITGGIRITDLTSKALVEAPDVQSPTLGTAIVDYNNGKLIINASETLDVDHAPTTSQYNLGKIFISETSGSHLFSLEGAHVVPKDGASITLHLTEVQRSAAINASGTSGGNGDRIVIDALSGFVEDVGRNDNFPKNNIFVDEIGDTTPPFVHSASINYSTGILRLNMSETIDVTPKSNVDLSLLTLVNDTALIGQDDGVVSLAAANIIGSNDVTMTIQLLEVDRVKALAFSSTFLYC